MFSRVVLRRLDPAPTGQADDLESQPLSPRTAGHTTDPEMSERAHDNSNSNSNSGRFSRLRRPSIPSRFRFSNSTEATSSAASSADWPPHSQATRPSRAHANTHPALRPTSSHYPDDDDSLFDHNSSFRESTLPSRYSVVVDLPSTRLHMPGLERTWTQGSNGPPSARPAEFSRPPPASPPCRPHTPPNYPQVPPLSLAQPQPAHLHHQQSSSSPSAATGGDELYAASSGGDFTDPAEAQLVDLAEDGRQRRRHRLRGEGSGRRHHRRHHHRRDRSDETPEQREERRRRRRERRQRLRDVEDDGDVEGRSGRPHPKHFLFCFPWIRSRKTRSQILQCFVSGMFLVLLLSVCKCFPPSPPHTHS